MYAIIEDRGKQHMAVKGKLLQIDFKESAAKGEQIEFNKVLLFSEEGEIRVGQPTVSNVKVTSEVVEPLRRGDKIRVFRYQRREGFHREKGHKQKYTIVKITDIQKT